jgi:hypothetical protein
MSDEDEQPLVYDTPLSKQDPHYWANTILWRLGVAAGVIQRGSVASTIDPDMLLEFLEHQLARITEQDT